MRIKFNRQSIYIYMVCIGISLMMFADLLAEVLPGTLGYADEGFALVCLLLILMEMFKRKVRIPKYYVWLFGIICIGLFSNMVWGIQTNNRVVLTDVFLFLKPYIILFYFYLTLNKYKADKIYKFMMWISKIILILMGASCLVSRVSSMGMRSASGSFQFLSGFTGVPSWWAILFLSLITSNQRNKRTLYFILSAIIIFESKSGLGSLALVLAVGIYFFVEKQKKFKWYYLLPIIPLGIFIGRNEIAEYFLNSNAPRFLLFYYAFITANTCFPFGAGFATYGSSMAISSYSELYYRYGFHKRWGMSKAYHPFLMDSYFPQIIGQFGYIGTGLYVLFSLMLLRKLIFRIDDKNCRCSCLYLFMCWFIAGLGFGTASYWGCTIYFLLPVFTMIGKSKYETKNDSR